jgi:hypothetical protein
MTFQSTGAVNAKTQINRRKFLLKTMLLVSFQNLERIRLSLIKLLTLSLFFKKTTQLYLPVLEMVS